MPRCATAYLLPPLVLSALATPGSGCLPDPGPAAPGPSSPRARLPPGGDATLRPGSAAFLSADASRCALGSAVESEDAEDDDVWLLQQELRWSPAEEQVAPTVAKAATTVAAQPQARHKFEGVLGLVRSFVPPTAPMAFGQLSMAVGGGQAMPRARDSDAAGTWYAAALLALFFILAIGIYAIQQSRTWSEDVPMTGRGAGKAEAEALLKFGSGPTSAPQQHKGADVEQIERFSGTTARVSQVEAARLLDPAVPALVPTSSTAMAAPPPGGTAVANGPILCPSLVLPNMESRFLISMEGLHGGVRGSPMDITGTSGRRLLQAAVVQLRGSGLCLRIYSPGCEDDPRASVRHVQGTSLTVLGRGDQAFGVLESRSQTDQVLIQDGQPILKFDTLNASELQMRASVASGYQLASASRVADAWRLQVKAGADAVLIASCMLSTIFFLHSQLGPAAQEATPRPSSGGGPPLSPPRSSQGE